MENIQRYHDISDRVWRLLEALLPGQKGRWGGVAKDNRTFLNGVFWVMHTGASWRDLPPEYGKWNTVYQRFKRWRDNGIWEKILEVLIDEPDFEWLMINSDYVKAHSCAIRAEGDQDTDSDTGHLAPKYICPWMQMVCRSEYLLRHIPQCIASKLVTLTDASAAKGFYPIGSYDVPGKRSVPNQGL